MFLYLFKSEANENPCIECQEIEAFESFHIYSYIKFLFTDPEIDRSGRAINESLHSKRSSNGKHQAARGTLSNAIAIHRRINFGMT